MAESTFDANAFMADVEKSDGAPIVLSRYGFKKTVVDGKTYLEAQSKDDVLVALATSTDKTALTQLQTFIRQDLLEKRCVSASVGICRSLGCSGCDPEPAGGGGYLCYCIP